MERAARERSRRWFTLAAVGAAVIFLVLAFLAWGQRNQAIHETNLRATAQAEAEAEADLRATAQKEAGTKRQEAEQQRQIALARQWLAVGQLEFDRTAKVTC